MSTFEQLLVQLLVGSGVVIVSYYLLINTAYLIIHVLGLLELRDDVREGEWTPPYRPFSSPFYPGVGIILPAYNEQATVVESVRSMLQLNYPDQEIIVVNDGSTDATLERLKAAFALEAVETEIPYDVPTEPIRNVYRSTKHEELLIIDKENGGKSDALNAGVWLTEQELFCAVDADTVIDRNALLQVVRPFLEEPERAVASGGTLRVANNCVIEDGEVQEVSMPTQWLPGIQVMEYLRAFYSGRLGFDRLKGVVLISGAFGVFRTDRVREIGGYRHDTVTEDFDIIVRLHKYLTDNDIDYTVDFVPEPVAWTEVPENFRTLGRQRRRWYRGMVETIVENRKILFRKRYGRVGTAVLPFFIAAEAFGPLIEGLGYIILPVAWYLDILSIEFFIAFFLLTTGYGVFLSWFGIFSEVWTFNRYERPREVVQLLWYGILENFGYRQWKTLIAWQGLFEFLRGEQSWGVMERKGFGEWTSEKTTAAATAVGVATGEQTTAEKSHPAAPAGSDTQSTTAETPTPTASNDATDRRTAAEKARATETATAAETATTDDTSKSADSDEAIAATEIDATGFIWVHDPFSHAESGFVWNTPEPATSGFQWLRDQREPEDSGFRWNTPEDDADGFEWGANIRDEEESS